MCNVRGSRGYEVTDSVSSQGINSIYHGLSSIHNTRNVDEDLGVKMNQSTVSVIRLCIIY